MKSGVWIGGLFVRGAEGRSFAAGYPEEQDLVIQAAEVDPTTGEFARNSSGGELLTQSSLLVRWDEVEYLELTEVPSG